MSVIIIHGANRGTYPVGGKTIGAVRQGLRDSFNISAKAVGLVNGRQRPDDSVLEAGDHLEFCQASGQKGGLHDFWSKSEVMELFGADAIEELREMGIEPVKEPVFTREQIAAWQAARRTGRPKDGASERLVVDFSTMTMQYGKQGPYPFDSTLKYRLLARLGRRPGFYVGFDDLKRDVWELEDTDDETVSREIRRLRNALEEIGLCGVTIDMQRHRVALKLA